MLSGISHNKKRHLSTSEASRFSRNLWSLVDGFHQAAEVPLTSLVAETVLRNLPEIPEGLEVVKLPMKMSEVAQLLGICVRPDAEMCWLILRSLCHLDERRGAKKHTRCILYTLEFM